MFHEYFFNKYPNTVEPDKDEGNIKHNYRKF